MRKIVLTAIAMTAIAALSSTAQAMPLAGAATLKSAANTAQSETFTQVRTKRSYQSSRDQDHGWQYGNRNWRSYSRAGQKCS